MPRAGRRLTGCHRGPRVPLPPPPLPPVSPHPGGSWIKSGSWHPRCPVPLARQGGKGLRPGRGSRGRMAGAQLSSPLRMRPPGEGGMRTKPSGCGDARRRRTSGWHGRRDSGGSGPEWGAPWDGVQRGVHVSRPSSHRPALGHVRLAGPRHAPTWLQTRWRDLWRGPGRFGGHPAAQGEPAEHSQESGRTPGHTRV